MFNTWKPVLIILLTTILISSCSNKIIPDKPFLSGTSFKMDSLPESEINIPIQVNMKPLYQLAEKNVAAVFTSPNWPDDWITIDCGNRYKYQFRRGPLQFTAAGSAMTLGFTGFYKIIGSTRICVGGTVVSPWTPPCRCGFDEGERRVNVGFVNTLQVLNNYKINLNITRQDPVPVDKCTVCFFGADITNQVLKGLKDELDLAKKAIQDSFGVVDIKPQVQQLWNRLNTSYNLYGLGWLKINPQKIRLTRLFAQNDSLHIFLGLTAKPVISFEKSTDLMTLLPDIDNSISKPGFNIFLDAVLNYDSLSNILNTQLKGKEFDLSNGKSKKIIVVQDCRLYGTGNEKLIIKMSFSGSNSGIAYFTGKPFYDADKKMIEVRDIDFDVKTKNLLLKSADWLFNKRITNEITRVSKFELAAYIDTAKNMIDRQLNTELIRGVKSTGTIKDLKIAGFYPMTEYFIIRSNASGDLMIKVESMNFNLQ
ncbi:MAG TPA: DUF4403 family protein [Chitinophagaceae bacterium]|nr:DUF4403 family protein [Chitinophagaceae bacterium]